MNDKPTSNNELDRETFRVLTVIQESQKHIVKDLEDIKEALKKDYVTQQEFAPVKRVVYGAVGVILLGALGAILKVAGLY